MQMRTATHTASSGRGAYTPPLTREPHGLIEAMGAQIPFARNTEIYGEGEPAEYVYKLIQGAVRTSKILADGRRQIGAFYLPGDVFGLEVDEEHAFSAEAISDVKVLIAKRSAILDRASRDSSVAQELWSATGTELRRMQEHLLLLIKSAEERVAGFLLEMAARNRSLQVVDLPMSRQDIADYLGLTIETVSRTFTHLESSCAISVPTARRIELRNRSALAKLNS